MMFVCLFIGDNDGGTGVVGFDDGDSAATHTTSLHGHGTLVIRNCFNYSRFQVDEWQ